MFNAVLRRKWLATVVVAAGVLVSACLGAVAYASIPDVGGAIHGCYKTNGGNLRVIDPSAGGACQSSETPLDWSQTGPRGQRGPTGAEGPQGPQGPEGSGHAFTATSGGFVTIHGPTAVITLDGLPAGKYLVWSPVEVVGDTDSGTNNTCDWIVNGSTIVLADGDTFMYDSHDDAFGRADMSGIVTLPSDNSTIVVNCDANTDGAQEFGRITALKVGAIN
jgi:hypothetical protein